MRARDIALAAEKQRRAPLNVWCVLYNNRIESERATEPTEPTETNETNQTDIYVLAQSEPHRATVWVYAL